MDAPFQVDILQSEVGTQSVTEPWVRSKSWQEISADYLYEHRIAFICGGTGLGLAIVLSLVIVFLIVRGRRIAQKSAVAPMVDGDDHGVVISRPGKYEFGPPIPAAHEATTAPLSTAFATIASQRNARSVSTRSGTSESDDSSHSSRPTNYRSRRRDSRDRRSRRTRSSPRHRHRSRSGWRTQSPTESATPPVVKRRSESSSNLDVGAEPRSRRKRDSSGSSEHPRRIRTSSRRDRFMAKLFRRSRSQTSRPRPQDHWEDRLAASAAGVMCVDGWTAPPDPHVIALSRRVAKDHRTLRVLTRQMEHAMKASMQPGVARHGTAVSPTQFGPRRNDRAPTFGPGPSRDPLRFPPALRGGSRTRIPTEPPMARDYPTGGSARPELASWPPRVAPRPASISVPRPGPQTHSSHQRRADVTPHPRSPIQFKKDSTDRRQTDEAPSLEGDDARLSR